MNPGSSLLLSFIVAAVVASVGVWIGTRLGIAERRTLLTDLTAARRQILTNSVEIAAAYKAADGWREASGKWRHHYMELLGMPKLRGNKSPENDDPPTVGQADRRAMESRRAREEMDRLPIALNDTEAAPPPRLRDAEDDH